MIEQSRAHKHYASARTRFLVPLLSDYLHRELLYFGPDLCVVLSKKIVDIFEATCPPCEHIKPGQIVWNALDKQTPAHSKNRKFIPVILTLVSEEDVESLRQGVAVPQVRQNAMARVFHETFDQGGVLSTRDAGLLFHVHDAVASQIRIKHEKEHAQSLPHTGVLHDMGTTISHKSLIIRKVLIEKKDPATVARETKHSQRAVDRYLKDFYRVETIYKINPDLAFIHQVTGLSKSLINEYVNLMEECFENISK